MEQYFSNIPLLFGLVAAMIHVVSGPDHIAAVGPLAVNTKFKPWFIGMSWGIGHLLGMMIIGVLFYFFKDLIPVEWISTNSERLVGIMLIVIGLWGIFRMVNSRTKKDHHHVHLHQDDKGNSFIHSHNHDHKQQKVHSHTKEEQKRNTYLTALGIGVLHGLAGVSHFISLMPTLAFSNNFDSAMYLIGFGGGTILSMVLFSFILGFVTKRSEKLKRKMLFTSINAVVGFSAIIVGIIWIWNTW